MKIAWLKCRLSRRPLRLPAWLWCLRPHWELRSPSSCRLPGRLGFLRPGESSPATRLAELLPTWKVNKNVRNRWDSAFTSSSSERVIVSLSCSFMGKSTNLSSAPAGTTFWMAWVGTFSTAGGQGGFREQPEPINYYASIWVRIMTHHFPWGQIFPSADPYPTPWSSCWEYHVDPWRSALSLYEGLWRTPFWRSPAWDSSIRIEKESSCESLFRTAPSFWGIPERALGTWGRFLAPHWPNHWQLIWRPHCSARTWYAIRWS